ILLERNLNQFGETMLHSVVCVEPSTLLTITQYINYLRLGDYLPSDYLARFVIETMPFRLQDQLHTELPWCWHALRHRQAPDIPRRYSLPCVVWRWLRLARLSGVAQRALAVRAHGVAQKRCAAPGELGDGRVARQVTRQPDHEGAGEQQAGAHPWRRIVGTLVSRDPGFPEPLCTAWSKP